MDDLTKLSPHELFLVAALDGATHPDIAEIAHAEIVGLDGEFSPEDLITGFAAFPERIADVLERCVGTKRVIGKKTKPVTAIDNLTDALTPDPKSNEVASSPKELYEVVTSRDLVRFQDASRIWDLLMRHGWTHSPKVSPDYTCQQMLMRELLEHVLAFKLLTTQEYVEAISTDQLMGDNMPANIRRKVLDTVLALGRAGDGGRFNEDHLVAIVKPNELVQHVELHELERVLLAVAKKYGWIKEKPAIEEPKPLVTPPEQAADDAMTNPPPPGADEKQKDDDGEPVLEVTPGEAGAVLLASDEEAHASDADLDAVIDGIKREGEPGMDFAVEDPMHVRGQDGVFRPRKEGSGVNPFPKPAVKPPPLHKSGKR